MVRTSDTSPISLHSLADAVLRRLGGAHRARLVRLWQHWNMVLGPELSSLAHPLGHKNTLLLLGAEDSITMQEIHLYGPEILERVNAFMDEAFFGRIACGLLRDQRPLNIPLPPPRRIAAPEARTPLHGHYLANMRPESAVARSYACFVRQQ